MAKAKLIAGVYALLVYASLGAASIGAEPVRASELFPREVPARAETAFDAALQAASDATGAVPMQNMSDEERERRQRVCDKIFANCNDQCKRFYDNKKLYSKLRPCRERCARENEECLKEIP